jgi:outer membrane protein OmpA-like peptidoglycan-associated protein
MSCFTVALAAAASLCPAGTATPGEQEIYIALRPAPQGLGVRQGIPTLGSLPGAAENPATQHASLTIGGTTRIPSNPKMWPVVTLAGRSHEHVSAEPHPAITFNTIQFAFGSAQIIPESSETLRNLGNVLNHELADQNAFLVEGHTDAIGSTQANAVLSRRRAEAVKNYLVRELGVSASRLHIVGKGSSEPANPADPFAAENRRVVLVNLQS